MNGDVNGTMEQSSELSLPVSLDNLQTHPKVTPDNCDDEINHCEIRKVTESSSHVGSESTNCSTDNGRVKTLEDENDTELISECETDPLNDVSKQENIINSVQNEQANSNESYSESIKGFHEGSEISKPQEEDIREAQENELCNKDSSNGRPDKTINTTQVIDYLI